MNTERKLASIQRIKALRPIEGADAIECAIILGWECVVKKGEFQVGDLCVFFEIDSVLPEKSLYEFMRPRNFRVKTVRLRGQISQGLALPIEYFNQDCYVEDGKAPITANLITGFSSHPVAPCENIDLTKMLGVKKYEPPVNLYIQDDGRKPWPEFIHKTDAPRVQLLNNVGEFLKKMPLSGWHATEKLDGCSATYYLKDGHFGVCSRNAEWEESEGNIYWIVAKKMRIKENLERCCDDWGIKNVAIQGEIIGPKIQGNKYNHEDHWLYIFDVFDIDRDSYLDAREQHDFLRPNLWKVHKVPNIGYIKDYFRLNEIDINDEDSLRKAFVEMSRIFSEVGDRPIAEGIVIKHVHEKIIHGWGRAVFKVINPEFLLRYDE